MSAIEGTSLMKEKFADLVIAVKSWPDGWLWKVWKSLRLGL